MTPGGTKRACGALEAKLAARIGLEGPLSYEAFVEAALYDEQYGYYRTGKVEGRDYATSPEIHGLFGRTIGGCIDDACAALGAPSVTIMELGGGSGRLASDIASGLGRVSLKEYIILEKGRRGREGTRRWVGSLEDVAPIDGPVFVVANEFFDALPFHKVVMSRGSLSEVYVGYGGGFCEIVGPPSGGLQAFLGRYPVFLGEGQASEVTASALPIVEALSAAVGTGWLLVFDYGYHQAEVAAGRFFGGSVLGYREWRIREDIFACPGDMDITHHVNFDHLGGLLENGGWRMEGEVEQHRFLANAGMIEAMARLGPAERMSAKWLINPDGLGSMVSVLAFSKGLPAPSPGLKGFPKKPSSRGEPI